ncbi:MAG: FAD-dependent oxidoreductase [Chloroflexi bacterium]|nr:FAD-dependent oxidoreductase [Chloroflexota bacterium]
MNEPFHKLFEPLKIGPHTLKNRIIKSPITTRLSLISGETSPQLLNHYAEQARGGAAMITIESTEVEFKHPRVRPNLRVDSDAYLAGLHELAEAIHLNGALACLQIRHVGMWGVDPISPAGVTCRRSGGRDLVTPRAMSLAEIEEVIGLFASAAYRAKFTEFDMVELHGGTSYLLEQFVSPHTNKRADEWGGSFENRMRLPLEIVRRIHERCGSDFPVGYRVVLDELLPDGITFQESKEFVKRLEKGGVAYISPMVGTYETFHTGEGTQSIRAPKAQTVKYTEPLKKEVGIPVFATFQIHEPELMESILERNQADAIVLGRPLLADPEMPKKIREGRLQDICRCIRCGNCNDTSMVTYQKITCTQNPQLGREAGFALRPAASRRRIMVVGGGPAGLEAARIAALRGHEVTLLEKEAKPGGQVKVAALPIGKEDLLSYVVGWRIRECRNAGVRIETEKEATPEVVRELRPDAVIIATGAGLLVPDIPGIRRSNVVSAGAILQGKVTPGKRVVVAGGGLVGAETADFIAEKGLAETVTVIEVLPEIAAEMGLMNRAYLIQKLAEYKVNLMTNCNIREITDRGVIALDKAGKEISVEADTVVLAMGMVSQNSLGPALVAGGSEVLVIGDCKKPRNLTEAILEGAHAGRTI